MRRKRQSTAEEYDLDKGTKQTRKYLQQNALDMLIARKIITPDMERAAREIELVYSVDLRRSLIKTSSMERVDCSTSEGLPDKLKPAYRDNYLPWVRRVDKELKAPARSIITDILVFDCTLDELDRKHSVRNGSSRRILVEGLKLYANMAWGRSDSRKEQNVYTKEPIRNSI